jgi:hypothetical protein
MPTLAYNVVVTETNSARESQGKLYGDNYSKINYGYETKMSNVIKGKHGHA